MNKTFTINLNGRVYNINDDAYEVLNEYLDSLKNIFASEEGANEIMEDIEARIGELFSERMRYGMQVISEADVQDMIKIMGNPCQIENEDNTDIDTDDSKNNSYSGDAEVKEEETESSNKQNGKSTDKNGEKKVKRLFRNLDNKVIAGVCSGLSCYLNVDAIIIRILFIISLIFSFGMTLLLYAILWAIMPEAKNVAQKLQMKGIDPSVENIRQAINDGEISQNNDKNHNNLSVVLGFVVKVIAILAVVGVTLTLLPILLCLIPMFFLVGNPGHFLDGNMGGPMMPMGNSTFQLTLSTLPVLQVIFYIACVVIALIPIASLIHYILVKNNKSKPMNGSLKLSLVLIWIVALIFVVSRLVMIWLIW